MRMMIKVAPAAVLAGVLILTIGAVPLAAADDVIQGVVRDAAGGPIRGAVVTAEASGKSVSRFTQGDGRYQIEVPAGTYQLSASAYGFAVKTETRNTAEAGAANFSLVSKLDVMSLTHSEIESLLPDTAEIRLIRSACISCHSFGTIVRKRGSTAQQWKDFLPGMTRGRMYTPSFTPATMEALGKALESYFGPDAPFFGANAAPPRPDQIKRAAVSDAALQATVREFKVPVSGTTVPYVHSLTVDGNDDAWFSMYDYQSNKIGRFHIADETFQEYPLSTPKAVPHTPGIGKDGRLWMALAGLDVPAKLASVDPATGKLTEYKWPGKHDNSHTVSFDDIGNVWMSSLSTRDEFFAFDTETERFRAYKHTLAEKYPAESTGAYMEVPGEPPSPVNAGTYDVAVDSKGHPWYSEWRMGTLATLDPATGRTREYKPPQTANIQGVMVDGEDNVWFSSFYSHKLGKFEPSTGSFRMFQMPTPNANPYGMVQNKKTGDIWFADFGGNHITRFNPKTEQFVEYPIPTQHAYPRFIGLDSKGRVWFAEWWNGKIGMVDPGEGRR